MTPEEQDKATADTKAAADAESDFAGKKFPQARSGPFGAGPKTKKIAHDTLCDVIGDHPREGTKCRVTADIQPTLADLQAANMQGTPALVIYKCVSEDGKVAFDATEDQLAVSKSQAATPHTPAVVTGPK